MPVTPCSFDEYRVAMDARLEGRTAVADALLAEQDWPAYVRGGPRRVIGYAPRGSRVSNPWLRDMARDRLRQGSWLEWQDEYSITTGSPVPFMVGMELQSNQVVGRPSAIHMSPENYRRHAKHARVRVTNVSPSTGTIMVVADPNVSRDRAYLFTENSCSRIAFDSLYPDISNEIT